LISATLLKPLIRLVGRSTTDMLAVGLWKPLDEFPTTGNLTIRGQTYGHRNQDQEKRKSIDFFTRDKSIENIDPKMGQF
jgi:hypothetical protein